MHILVTDAIGTVGRMVARQLIAAGHTVSGIAERPHACLDPNVDLVCAPLTDPILQHLADEADAVIHLAPVEATAPGSAGVDGVARVTHAAARAGARLMFVSQAAGLPDLYQPAEELVSTSWGPSLIVRIAPPVGRQLDWMVCRTVATLLRTKVSAQPMRVLHLDDLVRFLVMALETDRTGVVDLASPDTVNLITAWRLLRSVDPRSRLHQVRSWPRLIPEMDIAAEQEDWDFEFGWYAIDAVADTARGLVGRRLGAAGATSHGDQLATAGGGIATVESRTGSGRAAPDGTGGRVRRPNRSTIPGVQCHQSCRGVARTVDPDNAGRPVERAARGQPGDGPGACARRRCRRRMGEQGHRGVRPSPLRRGLGQRRRRHPVARLGPAGRRPARPGRPAAGRADSLPFGQPQLAGGALGSVAKAIVAARSLAAVAAPAGRHAGLRGRDAGGAHRRRTADLAVGRHAWGSGFRCCGIGFTKAGFSRRCG